MTTLANSSADLFNTAAFSAHMNISFVSHICYFLRQIYTVLSVNEYTPFEKYHFKQYLNEHKNIFQNVDKTKFYITSV